MRVPTAYRPCTFRAPLPQSTPSSKPQDVMKAVVRARAKGPPRPMHSGAQPGRDRLTELSAVFQS